MDCNIGNRQDFFFSQGGEGLVCRTEYGRDVVIFLGVVEVFHAPDLFPSGSCHPLSLCGKAVACGGSFKSGLFIFKGRVEYADEAAYHQIIDLPFFAA